MKRLYIGAVLTLVTLLAAGSADAHSQKFPMAGKALVVRNDGVSARRSFSFVSEKQITIVPSHDPSTVTTQVLVVGGDGKSELITLDPALWKRRSGIYTSYKYTDRLGLRGGIKSVTFKTASGGGLLKVIGGGPNWSWAPSSAQDSVWFFFRVENEWFCSQFGGQYTKNQSGLVRAKKAAAPTSCPIMCGNGIVEAGEACDDGNLNNNDGCTTSCTVGSCAGTVYDSTWEALQKVILQDGGCTNAICHGSDAPAGGLDLRPASAYADLVNRASSISTLDRIEPGDQDLSFLYNKLAAATLAPNGPSIAGSPMPAGGNPPISADSLAALRLWIRAGAPVGGVVEGTAPLLASCLPPAGPQKIPPPAAPASSAGVQLYAPPWPLPAQSEDEVCYSTYIDLTGKVPASALTPCPDYLGGAAQQCFRYHSSTLAQDPQSHHSIIHMYRGAYDWTDGGWGYWSCKGGPNDGMTCDPTKPTVAPPAGGNCGPRSGCTGEIRSSVACIFYGPPDYGFANNVAPTFGGSQEPLSSTTYPDGVYNTLPLKGIVVWNSHAFNLTGVDTTMEQYYNLLFAGPTDQNYPVQAVFDSTEIFVENVPPFSTREYCRTYKFPVNAQVSELTSHTHKRGKLFRIWGPPNATCTAAGGCLPNAGPPIYISTQYNDPVRLKYNPPLSLTGADSTNRTYKFCALYDNGATDPSTVKRFSTSPAPPMAIAPGGPCPVSETRCIGGPHHNQLCNGSNAACDSSVGAGDGDCDACTLRGGVTTEDEMYILLGNFHVVP